MAITLVGSFVTPGTLLDITDPLREPVPAGQLPEDGVSLRGTILADTLLGGAQNDTLEGLDGNDVLRGGAGADELLGGGGNDVLQGGAGNDDLYGGAGSETLEGGSGNDSLFGGDGNDLLMAGTGRDLLFGGAGADTFRWTSVLEAGGGDRIGDFQSGRDKIDLSAIDANTHIAGDQAFVFIRDHDFTGGSGQLRVERGSGGFILSGDVDGDRVADFSITVTPPFGLPPVLPGLSDLVL